MSHDQKPGKMRVVGSSAPTPQRRRNDAAGNATGGATSGAAGGAIAPGTAGVVAGAAGTDSALAAGTGTATAQRGKPVLMLGLVFIAGGAIGGAALPLLGIV
jgi:hypothetical protein